LKVVSALATLLLLGMTLVLLRAVPHGTRAPFAESFGTALVFLPPLILAAAALYVVRGYELSGDALHVRRLLWTTRVPLQGVERVWHDGTAMRRSLRIFGNGGLFAITGLFRNSVLGRYRAFATDPSRAVVVRAASRVIVLSPADPRAFVAFAGSLFPGAVQAAHSS
jgi:hypothetical protein